MALARLTSLTCWAVKAAPLLLEQAARAARTWLPSGSATPPYPLPTLLFFVSWASARARGSIPSSEFAVRRWPITSRPSLQNRPLHYFQFVRHAGVDFAHFAHGHVRGLAATECLGQLN